VVRRVKDVFEISEYTSLDAVIERLQAIHATLSEGSSPEVAIRGDDFFGQRLTISYLRDLTQEEAAMEEKYLPAICRKRSAGSGRTPSGVRPDRPPQVRQTLG
jgi:hypothetical protein